MTTLRTRPMLWGACALFALAVSFVAVTAHGQSNEETPVLSSMPNASVQEVNVTTSDVSSANGTFAVTNTDSQYIGNLTFDYIILGQRPPVSEGELVVDNAAIYAHIPSGVSLALGPQETRVVPFALNKIPTLPKGTYRLRIQLKTHDDRRLGWSDADITLGSELQAFGVIKGGAVDAESTDPFTNETRSVWGPFEGVNVDAGQAVTLKANIENVGTTDLNGSIILNVRKALSQTAEPTKITGPSLSLAPNVTQEISIPITAPATPGAYEFSGFITDSQGSILSSTATYRIVVKGLSASIIRATIDTPATRTNETATVSFSVVGSADRLTKADGTIEVALLNDGVLIGETTSGISLTAAPTDGVASVQLKENVTGTLGLRVTVKDQTGNVLATSTSAFTGVAFDKGLSKKLMIMTAILILAALVLLALAFMWWRRRRNMPTAPTSTYTTMALLLLILGSVFLTSSALALSKADTLNLGNGIEFRKVASCVGESADCYVEHSMVYTTISPIQNIPYGSQVRYDIRHEWFACANALTNTSVVVKALQGGGTHVTSLGQANSLPWTTLASKNSTFAGYGGHNPYLFFYDFGFVYTFSGVTTFPTTAYPNNISTIWTDVTTTIAQNSATVKVDNDEFRWLSFQPLVPKVDLKGTPAGGVAGDGPFTIPYNSSMTLTWTSSDATSCMASNGWGGVKALSGSEPAASLTTSKTFTLTCTGPGGTTTDSIVVNVTGAPTITPTPPVGTPTATPTSSASPTPTSSGTPTPTPTTTSSTGADLGVTITAPATVQRGGLISYSLQAVNNGPQTASQAVVTVQIPTGFTFNAASSSSACTKQGSTIKCSAGTLTSGQSTLFAVVFTVGQDTTCNSKVKNTATVSSATPDANTANDSATSGETTIACGQCQDGVDNDNDNRTDADDPACHDGYDINKPYNPTRTSESDTQCTDKKDNDGDNVIDEADPGCHVGGDIGKAYIPSHNSEAGIPPLDPGAFRETE